MIIYYRDEMPELDRILTLLVPRLKTNAVIIVDKKRSRPRLVEIKSPKDLLGTIYLQIGLTWLKRNSPEALAEVVSRRLKGEHYSD